MNIGKLSKEAEVSVRTLRYYEEIGLMPKAKRQGIYRVYEQDDFDKVKFIKNAKQLGFSLKEILEFVHIYNKPIEKRCQASLQFVRAKAELVKYEISALEQKLQRLELLENDIINVISKKSLDPHV